MQLKDLLKPHQLEILQRLQTTTVLSYPYRSGKTVNKEYGKTPIPTVQPKPLQPIVTVKRHRHIDKGNT